jgi:hypothetical protein
MPRRWVLVLFALAAAAATPAEAGLHAVYGSPFQAVEIWVADNGDFVGSLSERKRVIARDGELFLIEDRLTGPIVFRVADLATILRERRTGRAAAALSDGQPLVWAGTRTVNGREGEAYFYPGQAAKGTQEPAVVISRDPALSPLGPALARLFEAENVRMELDGALPSDLAGADDPVKRLFAGAAPLEYGDLKLETVEAATPPSERFALPAPPETAAELRARLDREAREEKEEEEHPSDRTMIKRAVFAESRLWLLTDTGKLSSIADDGDSLTAESPGGTPGDMCVHRGRLLVLVGENGERRWTLRRRAAGRWVNAASVPEHGKRMNALDCSGAGPLIITETSLVDLSNPAKPRTLLFSGTPNFRGRAAAIHVTPDAVYLGLNAGEWGGGLRRVDRRSGRVETLERNATGELCGGPLNTACDPVNGIAALPWRPGCVAAAVGLLHMMSQGRIVSICGSKIEQIFARGRYEHPGDDGQKAGAERSGRESVAFFGLAAAGNRLLAVGDNGLYRLGPDGKAEYSDWPRFKKVGGVLVSFALPDAILVITEINRRTSVSGGAPMLVVR